MYTTVGDLYKWDSALFANRIISAKSREEAFTPHRSNYGYGWVIDTAYEKKVVMHEGGIFGFQSFTGIVPADEICIVLLDNHQCQGLPKIAEDINSILNNQPYDFPEIRNEIDLDSATLRQYIGEYQLSPTFSVVITFEDGRLMAQGTGQGKVELFAEKPDFFYTKIVNVQLEFFRDATGKVTRVNLYQGEQQVQGRKIK
jgi:hypothetical protein